MTGTGTETGNRERLDEGRRVPGVDRAIPFAAGAKTREIEVLEPALLGGVTGAMAALKGDVKADKQDAQTR